MEGAPVTAATGALGPVVAKLAALLGSEYKLRRTRKDVTFIKSKLKSVHSILWAVWEREDLDAESKVLKKEALDLADDMHDAIDDFILTMERSRRSKRLLQSKIKASPFQDFKTRVDDVYGRCRSKWKWKKNKCAEPISSLFARSIKSSPPSKPPPRAPFVGKDERDLVGMGRWRDDLITYLVGEGEEESTMVQPQLKMASIVGMAGVGKTTLAHLVYENEEIKNKFQSRAFASVTPRPNMKEVLTSILQQVKAEPIASIEATTEEDIIHNISNFLEDKRYLVIIDDIWHRGEWEIIRKSFPGNNLGSRIVMTTRIDSVPRHDFDNNIIMNPRFSSVKKRWLYGPDDYGDYTTWMKPDMVGEGFDCDHHIVRMCGAVPLALLCMFSAMAMVREQQEQLGVHVKACDVEDMIDKQFKRSGIQNTPGFEPLVESLQLGYDDLPHHMLKTCLLYCSIYPENYYFHRDDLVMRWVAEGFIYKEDAAEGYFEELANRGLMMRLKDGGAYLMNPMIRNFLRWKLREDNFITCSSDITTAHACQIHRLYIDDHPVDDGAVERVDPLFGLDCSQIRSLVVFEGANGLSFEKLERVRVLDLQYEKALGIHHVKHICGLLRMRHLFFMEIGISDIPPEIARLRYLETLQVRGTSIRELPGEIGDLRQLKTLDVSANEQITELPREIGYLQHLETLGLSNNRGITNLPREIEKLQHLRTLKMVREKITRLPSEIGNLQNLETLDLSYTSGLTMPREIGKLQNLKRLLLNGTSMVKIPREIRGLKKLKILELDETVIALPWEADQLSKLEEVPEWVRHAWKNSDLVSCLLAGEILSIEKVKLGDDRGGINVGTKHMHIPQWIKDHFNDLAFLDIRICKLEEEDLKILRDMPNLTALKLRFEVVPRKPIAIRGEGFPRLEYLTVDSRVPRVTFQEGAMPSLQILKFELKFYGGPLNKDPLGINHLQGLVFLGFLCNKWYQGGDSSCISATIDVVRKEAQEHPNPILFCVSGRENEWLDTENTTAQVSSSTGTGEIQEIQA